MAEFDIDKLKKSWQQDVPQRYHAPEIETILGRSSRNYVKYIFRISVAEFLFFFCLNFYYFFSGSDVADLLSIIKKLGATPDVTEQKMLAEIYFVLKCITVIMTAVFVVLFYAKYRKIDVESSLKKFTLQIISFKKTVKYFILANILLLIGSTAALVLYILKLLQNHRTDLTSPKILVFGAGVAFTLFVGSLLVWLYYRLVYGILIRRLSNNLEELQNTGTTAETSTLE